MNYVLDLTKFFKEFPDEFKDKNQNTKKKVIFSEGKNSN